MSLSLRDKHQLYTELAKMVKAGFGFDRSAAVLEEQAVNAAQRKFASAIQEGLKDGKTISQSIAQSQLGVTDLETSVIHAAEEGGALEDGFGYLRDYFATVRKTQSQIRSQLIYPAVILHLGIIVPPILKGLTGAMMGSPQNSILRDVLISMAVIYALGATLWFVGRFLHRLARSSQFVDRCLRMIPLLGKTRRFIALERFCNVFRIYVLCGQKISTGLDAAGDATQSAVVTQAARRLGDVARSGSSIGEAMLDETSFPRDFARSTANAEQTGSLEEDLGRWSSFYSDSTVAQMEKLGFWLPRILFFFIMCYVGWRIIAWYSDYIQSALDMMDGVY